MGGGKTNRIHFLIVVALVAVTVSGTAVSASASGAVLRISVHDYVRLQAHAIARAQALVTRIYRTIDVDTCWKHTVGARHSYTVGSRWLPTPTTYTSSCWIQRCRNDWAWLTML